MPKISNPPMLDKISISTQGNVVRRDESIKKEWIVSTVGGIKDSRHPFETAIFHTGFPAEDEWVVVEEYDTKEEALKGHEKWLTLLRSGSPKKLVNESTSEISRLMDKECGKSWRNVRICIKPAVRRLATADKV